MPPPLIANRDRAPDRTEVRITSKAEIALPHIEEAIRLMLGGADVQARDGTLEAPLGAKVSARWVLQLKGEARKATRRADNFVEQLRGPGDSRDVKAQLPSGGTERTFISPDKNLKTARTEMHTKKAKGVLARLCPRRTFCPQRRDGVVGTRYKQIVKLDVREDGTTLVFNESVLREMEIDKSDIFRAWESESATTTQIVEWRS